MSNVGYLIVICVLLLVCIYLCKKLYEFSILILKIEESIEESLDILDENYNKMNEILQIPVFFDSLEVRNVISNIQDCHTSILKIANKLTNDIGMIGEINKESSEKEKKG